MKWAFWFIFFLYYYKLFLTFSEAQGFETINCASDAGDCSIFSKIKGLSICQRVVYNLNFFLAK